MRFVAFTFAIRMLSPNWWKHFYSYYTTGTFLSLHVWSLKIRFVYNLYDINKMVDLIYIHVYVRRIWILYVSTKNNNKMKDNHYYFIFVPLNRLCVFSFLDMSSLIWHIFIYCIWFRIYLGSIAFVLRRLWNFNCLN